MVDIRVVAGVDGRCCRDACGKTKHNSVKGHGERVWRWREDLGGLLWWKSNAVLTTRVTWPLVTRVTNVRVGIAVCSLTRPYVQGAG